MAASLTTTGLKNIAGLQKAKGHQVLTEHLGFKQSYNGLEMRDSIYVDYIYDNIMFGVEKGFPWPQISAVIEFCDDLFQKSRGKDLTDTLQIFKLQSFELTTALGERNFKIYADFLFSTFFRHFKLFQYVYSYERQITQPNVPLTIVPPAEPVKLKDGQTYKAWKYEQEYQMLEKKEAERVNERLAQKEKLIDSLEKAKCEKLKDIDQIQAPLTKETVGEIMKTVLESYTTSTVKKIKNDILEVQEDLEAKLEKTSLPRPQELGPPPRFSLKPKTPMSTPKSKPLPVSPKGTRKKSGSSRSRSRASKS